MKLRTIQTQTFPRLGWQSDESVRACGRLTLLSKRLTDSSRVFLQLLRGESPNTPVTLSGLSATSHTK